MVLFQVAGYKMDNCGAAEIFSFGIFKTKENAIQGVKNVAKGGTPGPYHDQNNCLYGKNGWCAWIIEIADIGKMTQNTLRPQTRKR